MSLNFLLTILQDLPCVGDRLASNVSLTERGGVISLRLGYQAMEASMGCSVTGMPALVHAGHRETPRRSRTSVTSTLLFSVYAIVFLR
jgi:hypothetical protein